MSLIAARLLLPLAFAAAPADAPVDFARDVRPLLAQHCFQCHGPKEEEGGLRLDVHKRVLAGGTIGPALVPGHAADSLLYQFITGQNEDRVIMPPKGRGTRLTAAECQLVARWIDQGAVWSEPAPAAVSTCVMSPSRAPRRGFFFRRRR